MISSREKNFMKILVDADGCPVVNLVMESARRHHVDVILICDTAHQINREGARTVTVSQGVDSVDFALVNMLEPGDAVVTQDYGLAAMCLAKRAVVFHQDGFLYTADNIDSLLQTRHEAKKIRRAGGRLKGPPKRRPEQDRSFSDLFEREIARMTTAGPA